MKRNKKLLLLAVLSCATCQFSFAQLSERVNSPTTFKTGTRPTMGNFGLNLGTSFRDIDKIFDDSLEYESLPVTTLKYYKRDDLVFSVGIKANKTKKKLKGDLDPNLNGGITNVEKKEMESNYMIVPGIEKHFIHSNILDAYIGARIPLGMRREVSINNTELSGAPDQIYEKRVNRFVYGLNAYFGIQAFIADLPFAIGAEFGISGLGVLGDKAKVKASNGIDGVSEYYIHDDYNSYRFDKLRARKYDLESDIRVSISYFFRK